MKFEDEKEFRTMRVPEGAVQERGVAEENNLLGRLPCSMTMDYGDERDHRK